MMRTEKSSDHRVNSDTPHLDVSCDYLLVDDAPRRPFRSPDHVLGHRLAGLDELTDEDLAALLHILDALVAKNRVKAALTNRSAPKAG